MKVRLHLVVLLLPLLRSVVLRLTFWQVVRLRASRVSTKLRLLHLTLSSVSMLGLSRVWSLVRPELFRDMARVSLTMVVTCRSRLTKIRLPIVSWVRALTKALSPSMVATSQGD